MESLHSHEPHPFVTFTTDDGRSHVEVDCSTGAYLEAPTVPLEALEAPTDQPVAIPSPSDQIAAAVVAGLEAAGVRADAAVVAAAVAGATGSAA